jgi:hypothetical protein
MLAKLNKINSWWAALIIAVLGLAVFCTGLTSPFRDDDIRQIVSNVPVHSLANIKLFFEGGTFYSGGGLAPLIGIYYRPIETVVYSLLYTVFGLHILAFHLLQLVLYIAGAIILYLVFKYSFKPALALLLALIFLVHPLNSQVVFAIPSMTDVLFFFFGILGFWLLLRFKSVRSLWLVALCLFLSMLCKETAIVFIFMSLLYLFWFNRDRLYKFIAIMVIPIGLYLALRINAVGLFSHENVAPINNLGLVGRLYTAPSVMLFYLTKFIFPWKLATAYYWIYPTFSLRHVLIPLLIDVAVVGLCVYIGFLLRQRVSKARYYTYLFFASWAAVGLLLHLQIIALDTTVFEPWFYFSMAGVLGMIGVILGAFKINPKWLLIVSVILIGLFGVRTAIRGLQWENPTSLSYTDIAVSPDDFVAYSDLANSLNEQGHYHTAESYALSSIRIYPTYFNYYNLGTILTNLDNYPGAINAYNNALKYGKAATIYEDLAELALLYGNPQSDSQLFTNALSYAPHDSLILTYLAVIEDKYNDNTAAKVYIQQAASYRQVPPTLYNSIMNDRPYIIDLPNLGKEVQIQ